MAYIHASHPVKAHRQCFAALSCTKAAAANAHHGVPTTHPLLHMYKSNDNTPMSFAALEQNSISALYSLRTFLCSSACITCMHHMHAVMTKPALRDVFVLLSAYPMIGLSLQGCCLAQQSHGPATVRTVTPVASRNSSSKHKQTMQKHGPGASESLTLASFVTHDPCQGMAGIDNS